MAMRVIDRRVCSAVVPSCAPRAVPCVQLRGRGIARATAGPKLTPQDLQARLQQKEAQLARMFESGRPMPKASEVAGIRSEIDNLRAALEGRAQYVPPPGSAPMGGGPSRGGPPSRSSAPSGPAPAPYSGDNNLAAGTQFSSTPAPPPPGSVMPPPPAQDPFAGLEAAMKANQGMGAIDDAEIARLEAENTILRAQAHKLLTRQAQLEQLLAEAQGEKEPELLLETTQGLLERMKTKLKKADLTGAAKFAPGAPGVDTGRSSAPSFGSGRPQMPPSPPRKQ